MMEYKGYLAEVELDDESGIYYGETINLRDVITFEGASLQDSQRAFADSVEDYLSFCDSRGEEPEKPPSDRSATLRSN